jgi:GNAT superfamily N-acetyltransferase
MTIFIRVAVLEDVPALERLIPESVWSLQKGDYTHEQMEGALGTVFGVDRQLIRDGTYFVVEDQAAIIAGGGWSKRRTPFGSDHTPAKDDAVLDPMREPAKIRAFFVHPAHARRGIGGKLLEACEAACKAHGFTRLELTATLTGEPFYAHCGFQAGDRFEVPLPNGARLPVVRMVKTLSLPHHAQLRRVPGIP